MSELLVFIFLLALWHVVLFFGHSLGVSVLLFIVPLLLYLYKLLKDNNKIKNWYGLLLSIPIVLLSMHYVLFNNNTFNILNYIVILILLLLMYVLTVKPTYNFKEIFFDFIKIIFKPFTYISKFYSEHFKKFISKIKLSDNGKKILKTILIILPVVIIVILLLAKADAVFESMFSGFVDALLRILRFEFIDKLLGKIFMFIVMSFVIGTSTMYLINDFGKDKYIAKENKFKDIFTIKVLVSVLNIVYIIFDFIQIKSLILHGNLDGIDYATYARSGFFELMVVSLINITLILLSKKYKTDKKNTKYMNCMNILMMLLTLIIIISSFLRMYMYEMAYGYTVLRLFVDVVLITEVLLMIPMIMYIINDNINISKSFLIIIICVYTFVSFINVDAVIARKNINRFYNGSDLDIRYLETYTTDNIPLLIDLYNKSDDEILKGELKHYFKNVYKLNKTDRWEEFNISKYRAIKAIDKLELK